MDFDSGRAKISKYLESTTSAPIIVDVADSITFSKISSFFKVGSNKFISASEACSQDHMPKMDQLYDKIQNQKGKIFLTHLSTFLKLEGEEKLKETLHTILDLSVMGKLVVITYQCSQYLKFADPRIKAAGRIVCIDPVVDVDKYPTLCFVSNDISGRYEALLRGINNFATQAETSLSDVIYIETTKSKKDFPNSLFPIKEDNSAYDILSKNSNLLRMVGAEIGTDDEWIWLLDEIGSYEGWEDYVEKSFGNHNALLHNIGNMTTMSDKQKWAYFLALKCYGVQNNEYLEKVLKSSNTLGEFWDKLYSLILNTEVNSYNFKKFYDCRKDILKKVEVPMAITTAFCKQVLSKNENAIYYLTDCSIQEKELAIELIAKYADVYTPQVLEAILATVYPSLHSYLSQFDYGDERLSEYFNAYKYNKLINKIQPKFMELVSKYAEDRFYYSLLDRRSSIVANKDKSESKMYFVDALGVEFLNFIRELCYSKQLSFDVDMAYCELPSITSINKEFCDEFASHVDVKDLDELKHSGNDGYDYQTTKTPIHVIKELEILSRVITNVEKDLYQDGIKKVFLISDHGASRLAVINENENKWALKEKGEHSGRCCPTSDVDEKPDFAAEDNGFWCIANYDRFKGGRKANVEVHGGATLEEVVVPVIEIKLAGDKPKCEICQNSKTIKVSYKQKAKIQIFIAKQTTTAKVFCEGKYYDAVPSETKYIYDVNMPEVKKGHHVIDIYDGTTRIADGLEFDAVSASASENRYF